MGYARLIEGSEILNRCRLPNYSWFPIVKRQEFEQSRFPIQDHLWSYFPNMKIFEFKSNKITCS